MAIHQAILASVRLETLPKATIDIFITIIETDGMEGCVAAGSIAASTALADAGIELFGIAVACSAVCLSNDVYPNLPLCISTGSDRYRGMVGPYRRGGSCSGRYFDPNMHACPGDSDKCLANRFNDIQ